MYKFRIKFILSESAYFNVDKNSILINSGSRSYYLSAANIDKNISESSILVLVGKGFGTKKEAYDSGKHLIDILKISSLRMGLGINFGNDEDNGGLTTYALELLYDKFGYQTLNDIYGLMVIEEKGDTIFVDSSVTGVAIADINRFKREFQKLHDFTISLPEKLVDGFELFNLTQFNMQIRIKFLLYIIIIESLIEVKVRRSDVVNHINSLISLTNESNCLERNEKQSLNSSLNYLKNESISLSGRNLVSKFLDGNTYCGVQPAKFFTDCYKIRSKLVHNGDWKYEYERIGNELGLMVKDLLLKIVEEECIKS